MHNPGLSIIIPTYNEAGNIPDLIRRTADALRQANIAFELIFVDDHSTDDTLATIHVHKGKHPVFVHAKVGKRGKGYSILEGYKHARFEHIAMLDADLQYPPEIIPALYKEAILHGLAVANRKTYKSTIVRKFASRINAFIFGRMLLKLHTDVQSGLKIFCREIFDHLDQKLVTAWAIDIPLLFTAKQLGHTIGHINMDFAPRDHGASKVTFLTTASQIAIGALKTHGTRHRIYKFVSDNNTSMIGAGLAYKGKRFVTHTSLPHNISALLTFHPWQKVILIGFFIATVAAFFLQPLNTAITLVALLSTIYFLDVLFNFYIIVKSLYFAPEITSSPEELASVKNETLPTYSIMCPLYKEAHVLPEFVKSIGQLDWPKQKLDILLLLEADDEDTIAAAKSMNLPSYWRIVVIPQSFPKTKPKACNYGLSLAKGEYIVIYDAEDIPDPQQLKKAYLGFQKVSKNTVCLQAKLNYFNPHDNLLTRLFTAEYSLWFDVTLTGLQTLETSIPLGGTSNHFRTLDLLELQGWDPFNVTEDCDLGIRLFKQGYKTAIIDSTTLEEANSNLANWIRQRSRWIKGYIQTYLVHMRNPLDFFKTQGSHALIFQLVVGGKIAFMLINPFLWLATISYFTLYAFVGPTIESLYPSVIFYMAVISLIFGNFLCLYYYMIGVAKRGHWALMKYVFLVPFYWLMVSIAAGMALIQLITKPHYWEKTNHGLRLKKEQDKKLAQDKASSLTVSPFNMLQTNIASGGILVVATAIGSVLNFLYNVYLSHQVSIETFGVINLFGAFFYLVGIPIGALGKTITYRSAYLFGKFGKPVYEYWTVLQKPLFIIALMLTGAWFLSMPLIAHFFHLPSVIPLVLFSPIWLVGIGAAVNSGFLAGIHKFSLLASLIITDAVIKLVATFFIVTNGKSEFIYLVIPLAIAVEYLVGRGIIKYNAKKHTIETTQSVSHFPKRFFAISILSVLSTAIFLTVDVLLVNHYLNPVDAGHYGLLSLVGKMVIVVGSMFSQFITPIVSREIGAGRNGTKQFYILLSVTSSISFIGFVLVGVFGYITTPLLFGAKILPVTGELPMYTLAMVFFAIAANIANYHQLHKLYIFPAVGFLLAIIQITGLIRFHDSITQVVQVMFVAATVQLTAMMLLHIFREPIHVLWVNMRDLFGLFGQIPVPVNSTQKLRILIFNWRDLRHKWAGGAEVYIHELAKRWVLMGHEVTIFCGNDGKTARHETIDGIHIIRRGGFFTVYLWAFLYYVFRFRNLFDVIIDSENGIPFFTPLYARIPTFLLIHHVHQAIFRERLKFPFSTIASFAESKCMPLAYRNSQVITVSDSSKNDIIHLKLAHPERVTIVHPGINIATSTHAAKTTYPSFLYLGRLQRYKNINIAITAFAQVYENNKSSRLIIAGVGEHKTELQKLAQKLGVSEVVSFLGRVTEQEKYTLFASSWAALQPSSYEGWSISVIEANASGTPVIASDVHGLRDSVIGGETGILVPPKNVSEMAIAMEKITLDTNLRKQLSKQALVWSKSFSWEHTAEKFEEVVKKYLLNKQPTIQENTYALSQAQV